MAEREVALSVVWGEEDDLGESRTEGASWKEDAGEARRASKRRAYIDEIGRRT